MKKLLVFSLVCLLMTGCVYSKITVIRVKGDSVKAPIGSYTPIEGEGIGGTIVRQVFLTNETGRKIPNIHDIDMTSGPDENESSLTIKK